MPSRFPGNAAQTAGQWYKADLGSSQWFNHIVIDAGASVSDYARDFLIEVSADNVTWRVVANGEGTSAVTVVNFPITQARHIRMTLKDSSPSWGTIAELPVFE